MRNFRSILEHVSICSPSQFVRLHGKPYRLFFERELEWNRTELRFTRAFSGKRSRFFFSVPIFSSKHQIRSPSFAFMGTTSIIFFGPELERNRTWETSFAFLSTAERRLTAERLNQIFLYARSRMRRHLRRQAPSHSSNFGTPSRSSYKRVCWLEVFAFIFFNVWSCMVYTKLN